MQVEHGVVDSWTWRRWNGRPSWPYVVSALALAVATPALVGDWLILAHVLAPLRTLVFTP